METLPEKKQTLPAGRKIRFWLLGSFATFLVLILGVLLLAEHFVSSPTVKQKIQQAIVEKTGIEFKFQSISLSYFPSPAIELQEVYLAVPDRVQAGIEALRVSPELLPLLFGDLRLDWIELESPEISLELPAQKSPKGPSPAITAKELEKNLAQILAPIRAVENDLDLVIIGGRFSVARARKPLAEADNLDLNLEFSIDDARTGHAALGVKASQLILQRNDKKETVKDVQLNGTAQMQDGTISIQLKNLELGEPALEMNGELVLTSEAPGFTLKLGGKDIDIDATRRVALTLAGDTSPTKDIFKYLRGGTVPQISFHSEGETFSKLGDLENMRIEGQLGNGDVSIPEIKLDLTEVNGHVVIAEGILEGTGLSTRLEGSKGHEGTLKVALPKDNDFFQLELILDADLAQAKRILGRIVKNPAFKREMERITRLEGTSIGKLVLGDHLSDIHAEVDVTDLNLTADYQRVPFPIELTRGQINYSENLIICNDLGGTIGRSNFSNLSGRHNLNDAPNLEISSGRFALDLDELFPWLVSFDSAKKNLKEIKQVTGLLNLSSLSFNGAPDKPEQWQFAAAGEVKGVAIKSPSFPAEIRLARGNFKLDNQQLTFDKLKTKSLDADLTLNGSVKGIMQNLEKIELSADGTMGRDSVAWLEDRLDVPEGYSIRTPLTLSAAKVAWQPNAGASFNGGVTIKNGPDLNLNVDYLPEQLRIRQLAVKDQYSDADVALAFGRNELALNFAGLLRHETLKTLFADRKFGQGILEGNFSFKAPWTKMSGATAKGHLEGTDLTIPLPSGETAGIEKILLDAQGPQVGLDVTSLSWKGQTLSPVKAIVELDREKIFVRVSKAQLCGIDSPGVLTIAGKSLGLDFTLEGKGLDVETSYHCLTRGRVRMTGSLDFNSQINSQGQADELIGKMQGPLAMSFLNGVIQQDKIMARILEVLNFTEIVKGRLPDLHATGFAYKNINIDGNFQNGKLFIEKLNMDGETLDIVGHGEIDIEKETLEIELLAAPFQTADSIVKRIPGVNYLLGGSLVAIPVSVKGKLADPKVRVMSPSSVGKSLLDLGERTLKAPETLIESINPWRNKK